ncbi:MAG TPA: hypothetical protein VIV60_35900 [Polyangiaceae bacterium]
MRLERSTVQLLSSLSGVDDLLSRTRSLQMDQRHQRDAWFAKLDFDAKEEALFELEVLLKATACFANPRNHTGPLRRGPIVAQDFRQTTGLFRDGMQRAVALSRQLLGSRDQSFVFHRYLETVVPEDSARTRLLHEGATQLSPVDSLVVLRHELTSILEVLEGTLRAPRVPYRTFYAVLSLVQREVGRNTYFNPLTALEFRPEFDRIKSSQVLDLIRSVPGEQAHRLVALTFLSLFRMLRYVQLLDQLTLESTTKRSRVAGRAYLVLSVLRSDSRALSDYLRRRSGELLGASFEQAVTEATAIDLMEGGNQFRALGYRLIGVRGALEGIAGNLRLEMRRVYGHELVAPDEAKSESDVRATLQSAVNCLRPTLKNAVLFLGKALGVNLEEQGVFDDLAARRETSERLRRDVWMFAQIVRAFAAKAEQQPTLDQWGAVTGLWFVREFLAYFRAMGYPLLRTSDYPRFDAFMEMIGKLEESDLVVGSTLTTASRECTAFQGYLVQLFDDISRRDVLMGVPFDRRAAASVLRLYLGD